MGARGKNRKASWVALSAGLALQGVGCAPPGNAQGAPDSARLATGRSSGSVTLEYALTLSEGMTTLRVEAEFPAGTPTNWMVDRPALPYVTHLEIRLASKDSTATGAPLPWTQAAEAECEQRGCTVHYAFSLDAAARELSDRRVATYFGETIMAPPSTWLLRPRLAPRGSRQRYRVSVPKALRFATGTTRALGEEEIYEAPLPLGFHAPYAAFGPMRTRSIAVGENSLDVHLLSPSPTPRETEYLGWIEESGKAVARYYGEFPAQRTAVFLAPFDYHGSQMGIGGVSIVLGMDSSRAPKDSGRLWVAAHEMVHVGFPATGRAHRWATEGLATYVETVARAQAGLISRDAMWDLFARRLPEGQPQAGDRGLDVTRTWARTYWGGALFWFQTDVEIARATNGKKTLRDALRGLVAAGGNSERYLPLRRILSMCDRSVGANVVVSLYEQHARSAITIDLPRIFSALGLSVGTDAVRFDESAPEAHIRRAIESPDTGPSKRPSQ